MDVIGAIDLGSPNLRVLAAVCFDCEKRCLLRLSRDCLTFEVFLMDVFVSNVDSRSGVGGAILNLASSDMVELDGDRS